MNTSLIIILVIGVPCAALLILFVLTKKPDRNLADVVGLEHAVSLPATKQNHVNCFNMIEDLKKMGLENEARTRFDAAVKDYEKKYKV
jgi:hypothetical protein